MTKTIRIIGNISAIAGIVGFIYPIISQQKITLTNLQIGFISVSILIFLGYIFYELLNTPKKYTNDLEIKKYMSAWVKKTGRTVIFTRDMSWVDTESIKNDLRIKARNKDLLLCLPDNTDFSSELKLLGAEVYIYKDINFTPKSRFTFINYDTPYSKVAIGRKDKNHIHYIEEYSIENTIEFFLAQDLVNLIKSIN
jgi:hypothetical protein